MNENRRITVIALGISLLLAVMFYVLIWPHWRAAEPVTPAGQQAQPASSAPATGASGPPIEPAPDHYPLPAAASDTTPLPELADSDAPLLAVLDGLIDPAQRLAVLVSEQVIRRIVVTVDNLPRERLGLNERAFKGVPGALVVKNRDGNLSLSPANESRYLPLLALVNSVGADAASAVYLRFHPLFDRAYRELGYPDRHFNDRLVQVIDHLLTTPELEGPIALVQPKVFYQFADPAIEARSAGQKMLIRMGPVNQAQLKRWLRAFRAQITAAGIMPP